MWNERNQCATMILTYNNLLADYELQYTNFSDEKKIKHSRHKFKDLFLGEYTYDKVRSLK